MLPNASSGRDLPGSTRAVPGFRVLVAAVRCASEFFGTQVLRLDWPQGDDSRETIRLGSQRSRRDCGSLSEPRRPIEDRRHLPIDRNACRTRAVVERLGAVAKRVCLPPSSINARSSRVKSAFIETWITG